MFNLIVDFLPTGFLKSYTLSLHFCWNDGTILTSISILKSTNNSALCVKGSNQSPIHFIMRPAQRLLYIYVYTYKFITDFCKIHNSVEKPNHSEPVWQAANFLYKLSAENCILFIIDFNKNQKTTKKTKHHRAATTNGQFPPQSFSRNLYILMIDSSKKTQTPLRASPTNS